MAKIEVITFRNPVSITRQEKISVVAEKTPGDNIELKPGEHTIESTASIEVLVYPNGTGLVCIETSQMDAPKIIGIPQQKQVIGLANHDETGRYILHGAIVYKPDALIKIK